MKYNVIYADCPWNYRDTANDGARGAAHKYKTMDLTDLADMRPQIDAIADKNCALFMWATLPMLPEAFILLTAWGFKFRTVPFVWIKTNSKILSRVAKTVEELAIVVGFGRRAPLVKSWTESLLLRLHAAGISLVSLFWGMGHWTRTNAEVVILGTRGRVKRESASVHSVVLAHIREHSRKPDEVRERIVKLLGDLPRIELFARQRAAGWDAHGDELPDADA